MRAYGRATIGCDTADLSRLSAAERERCSQRFGAQARQGPAIDGIAPLKRAEFAAAAERSCARHFYKAPVPMVASTDRNEERYERGDTIPLSGRMFEAPENVTRWAYCPPGGP